MIIIIIISLISIFKEDDVFLPYGPLMNTDNDYYRTFLSDFIVTDVPNTCTYEDTTRTTLFASRPFVIPVN